MTYTKSDGKKSEVSTQLWPETNFVYFNAAIYVRRSALTCHRPNQLHIRVNSNISTVAVYSNSKKLPSSSRAALFERVAFVFCAIVFFSLSLSLRVWPSEQRQPVYGHQKERYLCNSVHVQPLSVADCDARNLGLFDENISFSRVNIKQNETLLCCIRNEPEVIFASLWIRLFFVTGDSTPTWKCLKWIKQFYKMYLNAKLVRLRFRFVHSLPANLRQEMGIAHFICFTLHFN